MKPTSIRKVKSAERTLDLLEALAEASAPPSASDLSAALCIPKSSLFHLIGTLAGRGYVLLDEANRYHLGPKAAALAEAVNPETQFGRLMESVLEEFRNAVNETCSFNVQRGDEVEVVATRASRHPLTFTMQTGDLAPLYAVSAGKIILASKPKDWLDGYLGRVRFEQFTPNTIRSHERLVREIERARVEGFGFVDQEYTPGIVGVAAAVARDGEIVGAINAAIPSARFDSRSASQIRQQLRRAARNAEAILRRVAPR